MGGIIGLKVGRLDFAYRFSLNLIFPLKIADTSKKLIKSTSFKSKHLKKKRHITTGDPRL